MQTLFHCLVESDDHALIKSSRSIFIPASDFVRWKTAIARPRYNTWGVTGNRRSALPPSSVRMTVSVIK